MKQLAGFFLSVALAAGMAAPLTSSAQSTYKDVAGIFYSRCTQCHHSGGGAPFSMMNYTQTKPWASLIDADLNSGKMPPWPPDSSYTRFLHERIITATEKAAILTWIADGSLKGDTTQAPAAPVYKTQKLYGTPSLVLKVPNFPSNASSGDAYNCFSLPTGLAQDRILRAFEILPGNASLIHHVVVKVDTVGNTASNTSGACYTEPGHFGMGGYAPGSPPSVYPSGAGLKMGMRIKAGSKIVMQQHYPAGSSGQIDSTQIRLYFYPVGTTGIRPVYSSTFLQNWTMNIPAGQVKTYTAAYPTSGTLTTSISIFGSSPHAHKININMLVYAYRTSPVDTIKLIKIPNWDFDWQGLYIHPRMVKVPAGYKLFSKHVYDNTTNNPNNPNNPPQTVVAGTNTYDEMLFDSFEWTPYQAGDELIDIGPLLAGDSLLNPPSEISEAGKEQITSYIYPNPVTESATLVVTNESIADCELKIFDMFGNEVDADIRRTDVFVIGRGNLSSGVYFYSLKAGDKTGSGKLILMPGK